jgi:hypothetical protein
VSDTGECQERFVPKYVTTASIAAHTRVPHLPAFSRPILDRWFESEELKGTLATDAVMTRFPPGPLWHCAQNMTSLVVLHGGAFGSSAAQRVETPVLETQLERQLQRGTEQPGLVGDRNERQDASVITHPQLSRSRPLWEHEDRR